MTDNANLAIWNVLSKTDPAQTKSFKRAGGFSGTALKPMWVWQRLTEKFGPCGHGWGMDKPDFQVVPGNNGEVLVYCTVKGWYDDGDDLVNRSVFGVGGDKIVTYIKANEQYNRPERWANDDEAFKKAYTDALMNAFKFVGVGADIHMGMFDDNKYVRSMEREFAPQVPVIDDHQRAHLIQLAEAAGADMKGFCTFYKIDALPSLPADRFEHAKAMLEKKLATKEVA